MVKSSASLEQNRTMHTVGSLLSVDFLLMSMGFWRKDVKIKIL